MNFGYKETMDKQKELVSVQRKLFSKSLVSLLKGLLYVFCLVLVIGASFMIGVLNGIIESAPSLDKVSILPSSYSTTVYDSKNKQIAKLITSGSNRIRVELKDVPECLQWAFIDTEDARYYEHNGIDIQGIGRAAFIALTTMDVSEGASTITQQVLKNNVFTDWTSENTFSSSLKRKFQEQYLAIQLEKTTSKETILETYLNTINLGANTLGVQAASHRYFNKDVSEITPSEAGVIAAITQNPSKYNPIINPEENAKRRKKILKNMFESKHITKEEYDEALEDDVYARIQSVNTQLEKKEDKVYTYFVDEVTKQVMEDLQTKKGYTETQAYNAVYSGGLKIYTTQDSAIQKICDEELSNSENYPYAIKYSINWRWSVQNPDGTVDEFDEQDIEDYHINVCNEGNFQLLFNSQEEAKECVKQYKKHLKHKYYKKGLAEEDGYSQIQTLYYVPEPQVSFTVIDQYTGYVKAIVGGRGKKNTSLSMNRATYSKRQPGSTFKILSTYAPAIDTMGYTLASTIVDEPYNYSNGRPVNNWYSGYKGTVTVRKAIAQSMNICAVKVLTEITPQLGFDYLRNFGITTLVDKQVEKNGSVTTDIQQALALGGITHGVTNLQMTAAYATIANQGTYIRPVFYSQVVDSNGRVILDNTSPTTKTVLKASTASLLTQGMTSVITEGTGTACKLENDMPVSGKTGTTSSSYDLWFCGFTPYLTASIWTGYDENKELAGDQAFHERLWAKIMNRINEKKKYKKKNFKMSSDVKKYDICSSSGKVAIKGVCPTSKSEYFARGTQPDKCTYHSASSYSNNNYNSQNNNTSNDNANNSNNADDSDNSNNSDGSENSNDSGNKKKTKKESGNADTGNDNQAANNQPVDEGE